MPRLAEEWMPGLRGDLNIVRQPTSLMINGRGVLIDVSKIFKKKLPSCSCVLKV